MVTMTTIWVLLAVVFVSPTTSNRVDLPPQITLQSPKDVVYEINEAIVVTCEADGSPPPSFHWTRNGELFEVSGDGNRIKTLPGVGSIVFNPPRQQDMASYQCFAKNIYGVASTHVMVFRYAELATFPDPGVDTKSIKSGTPLSVKCPMPRSFPLATTLWSYKREGEPLTAIDITSRVAVDHEGTLHFASVLPSDEKRDPSTNQPALYQCVVFNPRMQEQVTGIKFRLQVTGDEEPGNRPIRRMWVTPSQNTFMVGQEIRLMCMFSGRPEPELTWSRLDAELDWSRATLDSFGLELVIHEARMSDAGRYQCRAQGGDGDETIRISITMKSKPRWIEQPETVVTTQGSNVEFRCFADPMDKRRWFINGIPYEKTPYNERRTLSGGVLTYRNITSTDYQVINCNVSNSFGYVWGQAYLHILEERPTITTLPGSVQASVGQTARLNCTVFGAPPPVVTWVKDSVERTGGRYEVGKTGLTIYSVQPPDEGVYHCVARNKYGEATEQGYLQVFKPTEIQIGPQNLITRRGNAGRFVCVAKTDSERIQHLRIRWMKDGGMIDFRTAQRMWQNPIDDSLVIANSEPLDSGTYTCVASNGVDNATASASLTVEDVPDRPMITDLQCETAEKMVTVFWEPRSDRYAPLLGFTVQFQSDKDENKWFTAHSENKTIEASANSLRFPIYPGGTYKFQVLAWNRIGWSLPSTAFHKTCTLVAEQPKYHPLDVRGWGNTSNDMVIQWMKMQPVEQYGDGFYYKSRYRRKGEIRWSEPRVITDWRKNFHVVHGLATFTEYEIQVECGNSIGPALGVAETYTGYSGETTPSEIVENFRVELNEMDGREVEFHWDRPDNSTNAIGGFFRGFRIELWPLSLGRYLGLRKVDVEVYPGLRAKYGLSPSLFRYTEGDDTLFDEPGGNMRLEKPGSDTVGEAADVSKPTDNNRKNRVRRQTEDPMILNYVVGNLPGNTDMVARIRIINLDYLGTPSPQIEFKTPQAPPGPVAHLSVLVRAPTTIRITWQPPEESNGVITGYTASYRTIDGFDMGNEHPVFDPVLGPTDDVLTITGLNPSQKYRLFLYAKTSAGSGPAYFIDTQTTAPEPPSAPRFKVLNIRKTSFQVEWLRILDSNPGSVFYVIYRIKGNAEWSRTAEIGEGLIGNVTGLYEGNTYEVRLVASLNLPGLLTASATQEVQLQGNSAIGAASLSTDIWFWCALLIILLLIALVAGSVWLRRYNKAHMRDYTRKEKSSDQARPMRPGAEVDDPDAYPQKRAFINKYAESMGLEGNTSGSTRPVESTSIPPSTIDRTNGSVDAVSGSTATHSGRPSDGLTSPARSTRPSQTSVRPSQTSLPRPGANSQVSVDSGAPPRYAVAAPAAFDPYKSSPRRAGSNEELDKSHHAPRYAARTTGSLHDLTSDAPPTRPSTRGRQEFPTYRPQQSASRPYRPVQPSPIGPPSYPSPRAYQPSSRDDRPSPRAYQLPSQGDRPSPRAYQPSPRDRSSPASSSSALRLRSSDSDTSV